MPKSMRNPIPRKAALVTAMAALKRIRMSDLAAGSRVHPSVFYRVVRGERTSARVDRYLARRLGVDVSTLLVEE